MLQALVTLAGGQKRGRNSASWMACPKAWFAVAHMRGLSLLLHLPSGVKDAVRVVDVARLLVDWDPRDPPLPLVRRGRDALIAVI
jgi:hypothetical protein